MKMICIWMFLNFVRCSEIWLANRSQFPRSFPKNEAAARGEEHARKRGLKKKSLWHSPLHLSLFSLLILNLSFGSCLSTNHVTATLIFLNSKLILQILTEYIVNKAVDSSELRTLQAPHHRELKIREAEMPRNSKNRMVTWPAHVPRRKALCWGNGR